MKTLVVGFGSIGQRHAEVIKNLGWDVAIVSRRAGADKTQFADLGTALTKFAPDYIVVSNETSEHLPTLQKLEAARFKGIVLVEKPLFADLPEPVPLFGFAKTYVGYNLRFHPLIQKLRAHAAGRKAISVQAYVGQYLPDWRRSSSDYRKNYSADKARGGGVLRDLSHELDYLLWIFGKARRITALGGHLSHLEINSDDVFGILMEQERASVVSVQMNYLDRVGRREITVCFDDSTVRVDLVANTFSIDGKTETIDVPRNLTYAEMHKAVAGTTPQPSTNLCTWSEALQVSELIRDIESSVL